MYDNYMAHTLYFDIPPVPKGRPRMASINGKARVYKPAITANFEKAISMLCKKCWNAEPLKGPLRVEIDFFITPPRTVKRKYPTVRPDVDNYCKSVLDAMNSIVYNDDAQIITLTANKIYREDSGIGVTIHELH